MTFTPVPVIDIPGTLEIEDFDTCGDGIDIGGGNGGTVLTNTSSGEWLQYSVDVKQSGKYSYEATVSSAVEGSRFSMVLIDGDGNEKSLGSVSVPQTGSLDTYQVKTGKIRNTINAGKQKLRITITDGSCNIDKIKFICTESTDGITEVTDEEESTGASYNLSGQKVGEGYRGIVVRKGKKFVVK